MDDLEKPGIPEFEKIDANKLYEALETIAELEKKWDESEKRTCERAEVEQPEVVGYRSATSRMVYEKDYGLQNPEPMMLVSQHDRIVGALLTALAAMTEARNRYNNLWNFAGNRLALAQVEIRKVTSERHAALAKLAELEKALEESEKRGAELAASYCDGVVGDEYGHAYCRYKVERDAALARVAELEGKLTDWVHEGFRLNEALAVAQTQPTVPEGYALIPVRETEAMHDAVMALLYSGVSRTDTQKLLNAYMAAAKRGVRVMEQKKTHK